jgi:hypothetical protein
MSIKSGLALIVLIGLAGPASADLYNFGAIAFNQDTLDFSYAINWGSQQQADAYVLERCKNCSVIGRFWNNCAALAIAQNGTYGWDAYQDKIHAQQLALSHCAEARGTQCKIVVAVCNAVPQAAQPNIESGDHFGRHGCWTANWARIPNCKD